MQRVTLSPKKICISFYFLPIFGQRSRSRALVSIPVVLVRSPEEGETNGACPVP